MSKIVTAINSMVSHPDLITDVIKGTYEKEFFFRYSKKHNWSIFKTNDGHYTLNYFPGNPNLKNLAELPDEAWEEVGPELVRYSTKDLATTEAIDSFRELYSIVSGRVYGMDDVLNDIIGDDLL